MKNLPRIAIVLLLATAASAATLEEGRHALAEGRAAEAVNILTAVLKAKPADVEVMAFLAKANWRAGRDVEAVRLWRRILKADRNNKAAKENLAAAKQLEIRFASDLKRAVALLDAGLAKQALASLRTMAGGYVPSSLVGSLRYQTAVALEAVGDTKAAARTAAEAVQRAPAAIAAKARLLAARLHILKLKNPEAGLAVLANLKLTGDDAGDAALLRARALGTLAKWEEALKAYAKARKLLLGRPQRKEATNRWMSISLALASRELPAPQTRGKANARVDAAVVMAIETLNAATTEPDRKTAFAVLRNAANIYRRFGDAPHTIAAWDAAAGKLKHTPLARRAQLEAAAGRLVVARDDFQREASVRLPKPKLADVGGTALDALDKLLTDDATDDVAALAAKQFLHHANWLAGCGQRQLAANVYVRFATRHAGATRAAEALLAAARQQRLLTHNDKALALAWTLLKNYPNTREAGEAVTLVTSIAQHYAYRNARRAAMKVYSDLLKHAPKTADAGAARFNLAGLHLAEALAANRKLIVTGRKEKAKRLSADFKAALAELGKLLANRHTPLRAKVLAEIHKVVAHFRSLSAWNIAAGVLTDAAKAAAEKADRTSLAFSLIDLRMAQGDAELSRMKALAQKLPDNTLMAGHADVTQLVIDLVRSTEETDAAVGKAMGKLDDLSNRYATEKLWRTAISAYVLKEARPAPKSILPRLMLRRAQLLKRRAMAELALLLTTKHRPAKLPETEYVQAAIGALSAIVKNHTGTPEAIAAVVEVYAISRYYQDRTAFAAARKILDDFAKTHATATFAEAVRLNAIDVSLAAARREFAKTPPPPAVFGPVLAEYKAFIEKSENAVLINSAYSRILSVPPLHVSRGQHKEAVALYEQFLKDFAGYDGADGILYRIAVTHMQFVIGVSVEGKFGGDVKWNDSGVVLGKRGETSGWGDPSLAPQVGGCPAHPSSRPAGEDVSRFADLQLARAEQQWMRRAVRMGRTGSSAPAQVSSLVEWHDNATNVQLRKKRKEALDAARDAFLKVLTDFPASVLSKKCEKGIQVIVRYFADRKQWADSAETLEAFAKALPDRAGTEAVVFQAAEARTQEAVARFAVTKRTKLKAFAARFSAARTAWKAFLKQFPKSDRKAVARFRQTYTHYQQALGSQANHPDHATRNVLLGLAKLEALRTAQPNEPAFARTAALTYDAAVLLSRMKRYALAANVYRRFVASHPVDPRAPEAALKVAHLHNNFIGDKRGAVLAYQAYLHSYNSARRDKVVRLIFEIGKGFYNRQEWTGAMMTLDLFLANYPAHALAAEAAMLRGDIYRENRAWTDAIAAYEQARQEHASAAVKGQVAFKIGQCYENLSQWLKAVAHYRSFITNHPRDKQTANARLRVHVLTGLAREQDVIDKYPDSKKHHWAQYEIARKIETDLKNPEKAMVEYAKVVANYPKTTEARKSQFRIGEILFTQNRFADARKAFEALTQKFPTSSMVDNAWQMVGKTFEAEADREAKQTRAEKIEELRQLHEGKLFRKNY